MTRTASRLLLGTTLTLLGACASPPPASVLLESADACPLDLQPGQTLILSLPSNPASGYRWHVEQAASAVLQPLGPEVFRNPEGDVIGGDGLSTWRFQVTRPGNDELQLAYRHAWDASVPPGAQFACHLRVQ